MSRRTSLQIAVVGTGNIGKHHVRILSTIPNIKIAAIAEKNPERLCMLVNKYHCEGYNDILPLLEHHRLDGIIIATPTKSHYPVARQTLKRGITTFIEKPIAATLEEARDLIGIAKKNKTHIFVGHIERFNNAITKVKNLLDSGEIGNVVSLVARRIGLFPPQSPDTNVIVDLAVHDIDIFSFLLNEQPVRVHGSGGKVLLKDFEDHADIFLRYPSGKSGYIQASWITPVKIRTLSIIGTQGYIEIDYIKQSIQIIHNSLSNPLFDSFGQFILKSEPTTKYFLNETHEEPLKAELVAFIDCVRTHKEPAVAGRIGFLALKTALKAVEDMRR